MSTLRCEGCGIAFNPVRVFGHIVEYFEPVGLCVGCSVEKEIMDSMEGDDW